VSNTPIMKAPATCTAMPRASHSRRISTPS
jgi:hypothetical protein